MSFKGKQDDKETGKIRVAIYSRAQGEDESSIQDKAYLEMVNSNPGWSLVGVYAEDPISGMKNERPQFLRLMNDCENGSVDCILCRSIAIFVRNTRKDVAYIRRLLDLGVHLVLEEDGVDSEDSSFEMVLTVIEALADGKACAQSETFKTANRKRVQAGKTYSPQVFGYSNAKGKYKIIAEEAKTVRLVFDYLEHGFSAKHIAKILSEKNIPSPRGKARWSCSTVQMMIENEKYAGDYKAQKICKLDPLENGRFKNEGILPFVYHREHHPAIISREQCERCVRISNLRAWDKPLQYPFGDYLRCPYCGHVLHRRQTPNIFQYCCEGEGACRKFLIMAAPVQKGILEAYEKIRIKAVEKKAGSRDYTVAIEALKMLRIKAEHPVFERIDYWWLDDLVEQISFGKHSRTCSELKKASLTDDRTISIHWRCGLISTLSSGVRYDYHDPRMRAEQWDDFILNHPDRYPQLTEEVQKTR